MKYRTRPASTLLTLSGIASGSGKVDGEHRRNLVRVFSNMKRCERFELKKKIFA